MSLFSSSSSSVDTSSLLDELMLDMNEAGIKQSWMSFGYFLHLFGQRSYAGIFFILAVLCLLPGISILAGFVMILPSLQLLLGFSLPTFPTFIQQKQISVKRLQSCIRWLLPKLQWLEQFVKPRYLFLSSKLAMYLIGLVALLLSIIVAVPFPLSNFLPAFAMLFISIGMLQRDGLYIAIGLLISLLAFWVSISVVKLIFSWLMYFVGA